MIRGRNQALDHVSPRLSPCPTVGFHHSEEYQRNMFRVCRSTFSCIVFPHILNTFHVHLKYILNTGFRHFPLAGYGALSLKANQHKRHEMEKKRMVDHLTMLPSSPRVQFPRFQNRCGVEASTSHMTDFLSHQRLRDM